MAVRRRRGDHGHRGAAVLLGPHRRAERDTRRLLVVGQPTDRQDRHAVSELGHTFERHSARRRVRHGLAATCDRARAVAFQGTALRWPGVRVDRRFRLAVLEHVPGLTDGCRPLPLPRRAVPRRTRNSCDHRRRHPPGRPCQPTVGQSAVPLDRHALVRAVSVPLADLSDDPWSRGEQAHVRRVRVRTAADHDRDRVVVSPRGDADPTGPVHTAMEADLRRSEPWPQADGHRRGGRGGCRGSVRRRRAVDRAARAERDRPGARRRW